MKAGRAEEAAQHYGAALGGAGQAPGSTGQVPGSAAFSAVLHSNRAAAHQALGRHTAAVSDCLRATALDPSYARVTGLCTQG